MIRHSFKILFVNFVALLALFSQSTSWKGTTSTSWATASNWTNGIPSATVDVIIGDANFTGASQPSITASSTAKSLTLGNSTKVSTLTISNTFTVSGDITIGSNGTITHTSTRTSRPLTVKGNFVNNGVYNANSSNSTRLTFGGTNQSISGTGATFTARQFYVNTGSIVTFKRNIIVNNTLSVTGTLNPDSVTTPVISGTGTLILNSGSTLRVRAATFAGNYTNSGTKTYNSGSSVEFYSNSIAQSISSAASAASGFRTLKINGSSTKTLTSNITINASNFTLTAGTFDCSTFLMRRSAAGGTFTLSAGTTYRTANTGTNPLDSNFTTSTINSSSTIHYYAAGAQKVRTKTYGNLVLSGSGSKTTTAAITVSGYLSTSGTATFVPGGNVSVTGIDSIGAGATFSAGTFSHTFSSTVTNAGTLTGGTSTITLSGNNASLSGSGTYSFNNLTITGSGLKASAATNLTVGGDFSTSGSGTFNHTAGSGTLTMNGTGKTLSGSGIILSNFSVSSGSVSTTSSFEITGDLSAAGTFTASSGTMTFSGSTKTISGAGTLSFSALNITGSISTARSFSVSSNVSVTGSLMASTGTVTFTGTSTLSGTANLADVTLNGTSLQLGSGSLLGVSGTFTLTSGTFNVTSTVPNTVNFNANGPQTIPSTTFHHLSFSGSGSKSAAGAITINGDLTIGLGTSFTAGSFSHILSGNLTNSGTFTAGGSTMTMSGPLDAVISGTTTFNTLVINKNASLNAVTLSSSITTSTLTVTTGKMLTGSNSVTVTSARNGNGLVIGTVTRTHSFSNGTAYAFEGPNTLITFASGGAGITSVSVTTAIGAVGDFSFGSSINREFTVSVSGGAYTASMRLHYEDDELNGNTESGLEQWKYSSSWSTQGKSSNDAVNNWVELNSLSSIAGRWSLAEFVKVARWTGAVSSVWENSANWVIETGTPSLPPSSTDIAEIGDSAFANQPSIASAVSIRSIEFGSAQAANLTISSGSLTVAGNIDGSWSTNRTHSISVGSSSLTVGGSLQLGDGTAGHIINLSLGSGTIDIQGSLNQTSSSSLIFSGSGALNIKGNYNYTSGTFTASIGTVTYNGAASQIVAPLTYRNLVINKASGTATLSSSATVTNNFTVTAGTFAAAANIAVSGNISIATDATLSGGGSTISLGGNWSNSGTFTPGTGTLNLNGGSSQSIEQTTFNNLTINKGLGTASPAANLTINGNLSVLAGTFDLTSFTVNRSVLGGTLTVAGGATLQIGGTANFPSSYSVNTLSATSTVEYNGTDTQSVATVSYGNLTFSNGSSKAKSLSGNTVITGNLTINSGATLDEGSNTIELNGNLTDNGSFSSSHGTLNLNGSGKSVTGSVNINNLGVTGSYSSSNNITVTGTFSNTGSLSTGSATLIFSGNVSNNGTLTNSGSVTFSGTSAQTLALNSGFTSSGTTNFNGTIAPVFEDASSPTFATVNVNNTESVSPVLGWTVTGPFTVASGATFNGGGYTHTFNGLFTNNGTFSSSGTVAISPTSSGTITLLGTAFTSTGTLDLGGTGAVSLASGTPTLNDLVISNTNASGISLVSGWTIEGDLLIQSGALLNGGSGLTHTMSGDFTATGTFTGGTSTVTFDNTSQKNVSAGSASTFNNIIIASSDSLTALTNITITGDLTNNGTFVNDGIEVIFNGSSNSTIGGTATSFDLLTISKTSAATTLAVNISELSALTVSSGTLDLSTFTASDNSVDGGTISLSSGTTLKIGGTSPTTFDSSLFAATSTVIYTGTGQTVNALPTYGNLTLSTAGSTSFSTSTYSITGDLSISAGTVTAGNSTVLNISGNYIQSGGSFTGGNATQFTITGNFNLSSGTFFPSSNASTHSIGGNWNMSGGTFTNTNSTIRFNGTGTQTLTSTGTFNSVTVNKASGSLSLSSDMSIAGTLTLTSGNINAGSSKVIITSAGTVSRTSGHIIGNLQKNVATGTPTRTFEIGDATRYTPVSLTFASVTVAGNLTASTSAGDNSDILNSGINPNKSVNRSWTMSNSGVTFTTYSATFTFVPGDIDAGASTGSFNVSKLTTGTWNVQTVGTRTAVTTQATGIAAFGDFQIGESGKVWSGSVDNNWNTAANWTPSGVPTSADAVTIGGAFTININTAATTADLSIGNASLAMTILTGNSLSISGNLSITSGTLNTQASFPSVSGTTSITGGTVGYTGTGAQSIAAVNYNNLVISGARTTNSVTFPADTVGIAGTLTNSATFSSGGFVMTNSSIEYNGTGGQTVIPLSYNNLLISGTHSDSVKFDSSSVIRISGTFNPSATFSSGTYSTLGSTIEFNGTGAQSVPALTYNHLTISGARGSSTVTLASDTLHIAGSFTPSATAVSYSQSGTIFDFNGLSAQSIPAFTYNSLVFSRAGTKTISASVTSSNDLVNRSNSNITIGAGVTVQINGSLNNAGTIINDGTVIAGN
ncbi:MAG: hypothetical protein ACOYNS_03640 [Bacteroidota bacterium]